MSRETGRETDSSSSGAQGRGGAAYPSGTQPYGSRQYPSLHPTQDAQGEPSAAPAPPEEPKTETTLTTRIRINIPGSRPIPPVVVRTPVADAADAPDGSAAAPAAPERPAPAPAPAPEPEPAPAPAAPEQPQAAAEAAQAKETSDWFAPRKNSGPAPAAPTGGPAAPAAPAPAPKALGGPQTPGTGFAGSATAGVPTVGSAPSSRPVSNPLYDTGTLPGYDGTPAAGVPLYDGPRPGDAPAPGAPRHDGTPAGGTPRLDGTPAAGTPRYDGQPTGPTTGPAGGVADLGGGARRPAAPRRPGGPAGGPAAGAPAPGGPGPYGAGGPPRMSDDTAILTPQQLAPPPGTGGGRVSGDTLTSGIPVVPPAGGRQGQGPGAAGRPAPAPRTGRSEQAAPAPKPAPEPAPAPAKKGRSKLVLLAVGVVGIAGVAYGAGLLLNHSDVPKGTTVLGVDIGGSTKEEAVDKLEKTLGKRAATPLQLTVGGKKIELAPDKAGLSLDSQQTVRNAAGSDYNPVSVIGSLFGGERVAKPVFPVDDEKLAVALRDLAGTSSSATEATIVFAPNKVTAVEGKPGRGLDVQRSVISVKDAFRAQVETGLSKVVELPASVRNPTVTKAELDRAMKEFAQPAMSDRITVRAGGKEIDFGPARSLPQILSMKAVDGHLVEVYDKKAITRLLEGTFDGVMITKGDGSKHQVSADDVAFVMRDALRGRTKAERTATIDLTGEG
ncbi:VanW family protein [Streptomyces omiyaensis]|uniref:Peptidoglycan binding domain-containing protein n=1 Tax=Streptomyces omiyaensis TaxID=68247 RepID=A0ABW7BTA4_9ACTN